MCGRFTLTTTNDEMRDRFGVVITQNLKPSWNIAPSNNSLILHSDGLENKAFLAEFGFTTSQPSKRIINARSETLTEKPTFSPLIAQHRCLVIASGWYEWSPDKTPYHVQLSDGRVMAMAGLYRPQTRHQKCQFVIVTTQADQGLNSIHHRCPAILPMTSWQAWLAGDSRNALGQINVPPAKYFNWYQVGKDVGKVSNDHAGLVEPVQHQAHAENERAQLDNSKAEQKQSDLFGGG